MCFQTGAALEQAFMSYVQLLMAQLLLNKKLAEFYDVVCEPVNTTVWCNEKN